MDALHPLTIDQFRQIERDLAEMHMRAEEIYHLMGATCGESDQRTLRAEEIAGAVQRLQWAMERSAKAETAVAAG